MPFIFNARSDWNLPPHIAFIWPELGNTCFSTPPCLLDTKEMSTNTTEKVTLARPWAARSALRSFFLSAVDKSASETVHFVQVGANDGRLADPIRPFIDAGHWRGLMIEPHPVYFEDLEALHGGRENIRLVNCAVAEKPGTMLLHHLAEEERAHFPRWARGCASLKKERLEHVLSGRRLDNEKLDPQRDIKSVRVDVRRLDDILAQENLNSVDILVADVEGFELQVLNSVDIASLNLRAAMVECNGVDSDSEGALAHRLQDAGLITFRFGDDLCAIHPERCKIELAQVFCFLGLDPVRLLE